MSPVWKRRFSPIWRSLRNIRYRIPRVESACSARLKAADAAAACEEEGLIVCNIAEAICFCPPMIIAAEQIDEMFAAVSRALDKVQAARA